MIRYMRTSQRGPTTPKESAPPAWRGLGCLLIVIVPILARILAYKTVEWALAKEWQLPYQSMG